MQHEPSFIPVDDDEVEPRLLCPVCGDTYIYPVSIACAPSGVHPTELVVTANGVHLNPTISPEDRGLCLTLRLCCEQGHGFTYTMQFRKGEAFVDKIIEKPADYEPVNWRV
jgi:hypothetical protein